MTAFILERSPVTVGLRDMLRAALGVDYKVEYGESPRDIVFDAQNRLVHPYAVIYQFSSFDFYGSLAHPDDGASLLYQITSVGRTDESAGVMSDRVRRAILERTASGSFTNQINAGDSMTVISRRQREAGMLVAESGLWNAHDLYDLEVQANG